jgi:hypothetical protein
MQHRTMISCVENNRNYCTSFFFTTTPRHFKRGVKNQQCPHLIKIITLLLYIKYGTVVLTSSSFTPASLQRDICGSNLFYNSQHYIAFYASGKLLLHTYESLCKEDMIQLAEVRKQ